MKMLITLLILVFTLQSCSNNAQKSKDDNHVNSEESIHLTADLGQLKSLLKPQEQVEFGKIYTDTVIYLDFDDYSDYGWFRVLKGKDTIALVYNDFLEFVKGEEIEISWKMDNIWIAGEGESLDVSEKLISAKRLKSIELTNQKVQFLWREMQYLEDLVGEFNVITLNEEYIKTISEPEKAALAYIATFVGNECVWDGNANESRSNLKCKILWALDLGYQCSSRHLDFIRFWFRSNEDILKEIENCPTTPDGATVQDTFDEIEIETRGNQITVFFKASGINVREGSSWKWTEKHFFEFKNNELIWVKRDVSPVERGTFEVKGN